MTYIFYCRPYYVFDNLMIGFVDGIIPAKMDSQGKADRKIGNNRILVIRFTAQSQSASMACYGACLKWMIPELSFPTAGQGERSSGNEIGLRAKRSVLFLRAVPWEITEKFD